jgi:hypothetical protein
MDVTHEAALKALMRLANETEMQLFHAKAKNGPLLHILVAARRASVDALQALASVDPSKTEDVRKLQNEVQRFNDLVHWVVEVLGGGDEAYQQLTADQEEVEAVRDAIRSQIEQGDDE